jgi:hypothetical protein
VPTRTTKNHPKSKRLPRRPLSSSAPADPAASGPDRRQD